MKNSKLTKKLNVSMDSILQICSIIYLSMNFRNMSVYEVHLIEEIKYSSINKTIRIFYDI